MEWTSNQLTDSPKTKQTYPAHILAKDIHTLLDQDDNEIKILSLDCFDTLLWRKTAAPQGVFFDAHQRPTLHSYGVNAYTRMEGEKNARIKQFYENHTNEVTLHNIYSAINPSFSFETITQLAEEELQTEMAVCYALPNVVKLIHRAHSLGMKVIIVSDTYLTETELRRLLKSALDQKTYDMIHSIFCSSVYKKSKKNGLFIEVMERLQVSSEELWHVGDNQVSDFIGAKQHGIRSTLLEKHNHAIAYNLFRMRAYAAGLLDSRIGHERGLVDPFLGILSESHAEFSDPASQIGYLSLGPILYAFSFYLKNEIAELETSGKKPKVLFLMRDGYLPSLAFSALTDQKNSYAVYISRFTAIASSFRTKEDIDHYLYKFTSESLFKENARQLLLPEEEQDFIIQQAMQTNNPIVTFIEMIHEPERMKRIFEASKNYRERLYRYLEKQADIQRGDTIIFADLGYTGTAQVRLSPVFKDEWDIDIYSRYLIACYVTPNDIRRRGFIDGTWCDDRSFSTIITFISLFEKLCSATGTSVTDYDEQGDPIFSNSQRKNQNQEKIKAIQEKTVAFIKEAKNFSSRTGITFLNYELRDTALGELGRLLFFPTENEVKHLKSIEYEIDMGSSKVLSVFDEEKGLAGLKHRGLFFMEKNRRRMRTNYPAELRYASIELSTILMMQERLKFDIRIPDVSLRREIIPIIAIHNGNAINTTAEAIPTYDGYYSLSIPIGFGEYQIGIQFGLKYHYFQIDSIEIIPSRFLYTSDESDYIRNAKEKLHFEGMMAHGDDLYESNSTSALIIYLGNEAHIELEQQVLNIVFRPIIKIKGSNP